jgi:hypothetical protein
MPISGFTGGRIAPTRGDVYLHMDKDRGRAEAAPDRRSGGRAGLGPTPEDGRHVRLADDGACDLKRTRSGWKFIPWPD